MLNSSLTRFVQLHHQSAICTCVKLEKFHLRIFCDDRVCWKTHTYYGSYEPGVAEVLDEDLVDKVVLSEGLHHHHSLSTQLHQDFWDI